MKHKPHRLNCESLESRQMMASGDVRAHDVTVTEGDVAVFEVTIKNPSSRRGTTVTYQTRSDSAGSTDFITKSGSLYFAPGESRKTVSISTTEDANAEPTEAFDLRLTRTSRGRLDDPRGRGTIIDDDSTPPPTPTVPNAPTNLTATTTAETTIRLNWTDASNNETGFLIERSANGATAWSQVGAALANATTFTDTGLTADTTYHYRVRAVNAVGNSAYSANANATTQPGPVDPPPVPTGEYGPRAISQPSGSRAITSISNLPSDPVLWLRAGTYSGTISLRTGQRLVAEVGTILNLGSNTLDIPANASVENLDIRGGRPSSEWDASVMLGTGAKLLYCKQSDGYYAGVSVGTSAILRYSEISYNRRTGIIANNVNDGIVQYNDVYHNNPTKAFDPFGEAGGSKFWNTKRFDISYNRFRDNIGNGIWLDYNNIDYTIRHNQTSDNTLAGIFLEIGYTGLVEYNVGTRDGKGYAVSGWGNGAAICIENSSGTQANPLLVRFNKAIDCTNGIMIIHVEGRSEVTHGGNYKTEWIEVTDNELINSGKNGSVGDRPSNVTWLRNKLSGNSRLVGL